VPSSTTTTTTPAPTCDGPGGTATADPTPADLLRPGADPCPLADQTPPASTNGIVVRNGLLWIASLTGKQIVVADPDTGAIVGRWDGDDGITSQVDDLVITADGTIYWTGFDTGEVGKLSPDGHSTKLADVAADIDPIALGPDGQLYVARSLNSDGFYKVDPATGTVTPIADNVGNTNAYVFGSDGLLWAPSMAEGSGLIRIDPATGATTQVAGGIASADAVRLKAGADGTLDESAAYVLSAYPAQLSKVDLATKAVTVAVATLPNPVADNFAFGNDGRTFITAYNAPNVSVVGTDGTVTNLAIGHA
jgi:sugar lactone lactonase YvrE